MRASRLLSILLLLQNRGRMTAPQLAAELEVSVRTVYRDVEALAAAGVPVYADHGRTGGYQLVDGYRTRLTGLSAAEVESLFLVGFPGAADALGLTRQVAAVELKLLAALAPAQRDAAVRLRDRFHVDVPPWYREESAPPQLAALADAVLGERRVDVTYRRWAAPREVRRTLDPYGLVLKGGTWYVVAGGARGVRGYRVSNVLRLEVTGERFTRPDGFDLAGEWQRQLRDFETGRFTGTALLRVSPSLQRRIHDCPDTVLVAAVSAAAGPPDSDGWLPVELPVESDTHAAAQLIRHGAEVEVLAPESLRESLLRLAASVAGMYQHHG